MTTVPVGLLGLHTNTRRVRGLTAAAIASTSCRKSASNPTVTTRAPPICVTIGYASNERQANTTSSVGSRQVADTSCWHRLTEPHPTAIRAASTRSTCDSRSVSPTTARSG